MKRIHIEDIRGPKSTFNLKTVSIIIFFSGLVNQIFKIGDELVNFGLVTIGAILYLFQRYKVYRYRHFIQFEKDGATIRLENTIGLYLKYDQMKSLKFKEEYLTIVEKKSQTVHRFRCEQFNKDDVQKVIELIKSQIKR